MFRLVLPLPDRFEVEIRKCRLSNFPSYSLSFQRFFCFFCFLPPQYKHKKADTRRVRFLLYLLESIY